MLLCLVIPQTRQVHNLSSKLAPISFHSNFAVNLKPGLLLTPNCTTKNSPTPELVFCILCITVILIGLKIASFVFGNALMNSGKRQMSLTEGD